MFTPKIVTHIKLKPLLPKGSLDRFDSEKVLKSLRRQVVKEIKKQIMGEPFSQPAKKALADGFKITIGANSVTFHATDPRFRPLLNGQKAGQMRWLTKARGPIPIITDSGKLIFRNATPRSMENGSWYHPGRKPTRVIEKARVIARDVVKKRLKKQLQKQLRQAMRRR